MKTFEIVIADTKIPKLTVTPTRISIKHDGKRDYNKEIEFLKSVSEELNDIEFSARGHLFENEHVFKIIMCFGAGKTRKKCKTFKQVKSI